MFIITFFQGVWIVGLGLFSFSHAKLDFVGKKYTMTKQPEFLLTERISHIYGLKQSEQHIIGKKTD